jgi:Tol biopolymer transport system component
MSPLRSITVAATASLIVALGSPPAAAAAQETGAPGLIAYMHVNRSTGVMSIRGVDVATGTASWLAGGSSPAWSPGGHRLAFINSRHHITIRNRDGSVTGTQVPAASQEEYTASAVSWSPDGTRIAFSYSDAVWLMNSTRPYLPRQLTASPSNSPSWSPDSRRILYTNGAEGDLHVIGADGTGDVNVTQSPSVLEERADWSPDGLSFAYLAVRTDRPDPPGVFVSASNGTGAHLVAGTSEFCCGAPSWSPDSQRIAFIGDDGLSAVDRDGTDLRVLVPSSARHTPNNFQPAWNPV